MACVGFAHANESQIFAGSKLKSALSRNQGTGNTDQLILFLLAKINSLQLARRRVIDATQALAMSDNSFAHVEQRDSVAIQIGSGEAEGFEGEICPGGNQIS